MTHHITPDAYAPNQEVVVKQGGIRSFILPILIGLVIGLVVGGVFSYFMWALPAQSELASTRESMTTIRQAALKNAPTATPNIAQPEKPKMIPMWSQFGNCFTMTTERLYHNGTMAAVTAAIAAGAHGPGLPDPLKPGTILAGALIWLPMSITVHGKTYNADLSVVEADASRATPTTNASSSSEKTLRVPTRDHGIRRIATTMKPVAPTSAMITIANVRADIPADNIQAVGTIGPHAPPTLNALRKERPCDRTSLFSV